MKKDDLEKRLAALEQELVKNKEPEPAAAKSVQKRKRLALSWPKTHRRLWALFAVTLVVAAISAPLYIKLHHTKPTAQAPSLQQITNSASFEVYIPGDLPQGFTFKPESLSISSGIVIYTITGPNNSIITVTEQKKPNNFDYHSIQTEQSFKTPFGVATAYEQSDKSMGSLITNTTWVVLNSSKSIGAKAMEGVLQSLQTSK